jgi:hypothetical protein
MDFSFPFFTSCNAVPCNGGWVPGAGLMSEVRSQMTELKS